MLILGCGNPLRSDDGAGILVAEKLRKLGVAAQTCAGEATSLVEAWSGADDVMIVDAVVTGAPVGTVQTWDAWKPLTSFATPASTHGLGLVEAIELARILDRLPGRLRVYGIEGRRFESGVAISPEVDSGIEEVVRRIIHEVSTVAKVQPVK